MGRSDGQVSCLGVKKKGKKNGLFLSLLNNRCGPSLLPVNLMEAWWKNNSLETRSIFRPTLYLPDINYAALSHLQWQNVGINKSNLPTQPPATEKPFVYLWIHLHIQTFNWEDDSKINIPESRRRPPPPPPSNDARDNSTPSSHLSIPLWRLAVERKKRQVAHGEGGGWGGVFPQGDLCIPLYSTSTSCLCFFPAMLSLMNESCSHLPRIICRWDFIIGLFFILRLAWKCQLPNCRPKCHLLLICFLLNLGSFLLCVV